jgi:YD repeat-containing protein
MDAHGKATTWTYDDTALSASEARRDARASGGGAPRAVRNDRVATRTDPLSRDESFEYDLNGNLNLTSDGVRSYTWNAWNELAYLTGSVNSSFAYDAFGRRRLRPSAGRRRSSCTTGSTRCRS